MPTTQTITHPRQLTSLFHTDVASFINFLLQEKTNRITTTTKKHKHTKQTSIQKKTTQTTTPNNPINKQTKQKQPAGLQ